MSRALEPTADRPLLGRSELVAEIRRLDARCRAALGIPDGVLILADLFVSVCAVLTDDADPRPLDERLRAVTDLDEAATAALIADLERLPAMIETLPPSIRRLKPQTARRFLRQLLGAAAYDRLDAASRRDAGVLVVAARRGLRWVMPLATAMDQCLRALTTEQRTRLPGLAEATEISMLEVLVQCDGVLQRALEADLPIDATPIRVGELELLTGDVSELAQLFGADVSDRSEEIIRDLSDELTRKIRGARDAIQHSADAASQAANSLVELIDRLLRRAFADDEVLAWIEQHHAARISRLTRIPSGQTARKPTQLGRALCFAYAGQPVTDNPLFEELAAVAIVAVRNRLEQLKHADRGDDTDRARILESLATVEAVLVIICRVSWLSTDEQILEQLRARIGSRAA